MPVKLDPSNAEDTSKLLSDDENKDFLPLKKSAAKQAHKPKHQLRPEIQTLRAIAIFSVLLFHLWEDKLKYGFLGVDIFFVISGYLMCSILSKKQPLKFGDILTFYERRFKRIIPLYLFITSIVLFALFYFVSEVQFEQIFYEALKAITFTSNIPPDEQKGYFDEESKLYFFLHTWSLSVEIQFYFLVPIIFLFFDIISRCSNRCFKNQAKDNANIINTFLVLAGIYFSFTHQVFIKNLNAKYMYLSGRIWQFFFGFMAQKIRGSYIENHAVGKENHNLNGVNLRKRKIVYSIVLFLLLLILFCDIRPDFLMGRQINRLIAIFLATYIVTESSHLSLMANKILVVLGDVSYSVYLIHWPLITWYRYVSIGDSEDEEISLETGVIIIFVSILLGYIVEKMFKFILKHINSWSLLLLAILLGYSVNGLLLFRLEHYRLSQKAEIDNHPQAVDILHLPLNLKINETLKVPKNETKEEMLKKYNTVLYNAQNPFLYCPNKTSSVPTNFKLNLRHFSNLRICYEKGNGTKNVVLIGNSHAAFNYVGVAHAFKGVYKNLYTYTDYGCMPAFSKEYQATDYQKNKKDKLKECLEFIQEYLPILQQWKEPIDVLIVMFGLINVPHLPINGTLKDDPFLKDMEKFYQGISEIPKELMIIQGISPVFKAPVYNTFMSKVKSGTDYLKIGENRKAIYDRTPNLYKRIDAVDCGKKCLKMNWFDFWCGKEEDGFCPGIDPVSGLVYFTDQSHAAPWGSIRQSKYMLEQYELFVKNKTIG